LFFYFWFCLLFCKLLWSGLGELVLAMERDPCWSIEKLYGECELGKMIGAGISREWREVHKGHKYEGGLK
jgi:hypothetical protein